MGWGCPALWVSVAFLKQPDVVPPSAPQKIKNIYFELLLIHFLFFINDFYFLEFF
jgi:hypothetical protein